MAPRVSDGGDGTVLAAYLHANTLSHSFSDSLMKLISHDMVNQARVVRAGVLQFRCGAGGLVQARNEVVQHFLDSSDAEWLWCVDSDMGFLPDVVDRLVEAADQAERPVVGALCFGLREVAPDGMCGWKVRPFPTVYDWGQDPAGTLGFHVRRDYTPNALTQVAGTGAACLLIHRSAAEKIRAEAGDVWFTPVAFADGRPVSEDLSFCYRLNKLGLPVFVHTGVPTSHHKQIWLSEDEYRLFEAAYRAAADSGAAVGA